MNLNDKIDSIVADDRFRRAVAVIGPTITYWRVTHNAQTFVRNQRRLSAVLDTVTVGCIAGLDEARSSTDAKRAAKAKALRLDIMAAGWALSRANVYAVRRIVGDRPHLTRSRGAVVAGLSLACAVGSYQLGNAQKESARAAAVPEPRSEGVPTMEDWLAEFHAAAVEDLVNQSSIHVEAWVEKLAVTVTDIDERNKILTTVVDTRDDNAMLAEVRRRARRQGEGAQGAVDPAMGREGTKPKPFVPNMTTGLR